VTIHNGHTIDDDWSSQPRTASNQPAKPSPAQNSSSMNGSFTVGDANQSDEQD
jgi:hypothetical protein